MAEPETTYDSLCSDPGNNIYSNENMMRIIQVTRMAELEQYLETVLLRTDSNIFIIVIG